jgi:molybdenum cofactor cytidylyltransferase
MRVIGLIIAAGFSGRINSFKPILKIKNKPLIQLITEKLAKVCDKIIIVTGYNYKAVEKVVKKNETIKFVFNENYIQGMFTSLKKGITEAKDSNWIFYHFVDQPTLPEKFYYDFIKQIDDDFNWIQPTYDNCKGHPILLHSSIYQYILKADNSSSLKRISQNQKVKKKYWNCAYPQVLEDIDTNEDLENLISREGK